MDQISRQPRSRHRGDGRLRIDDSNSDQIVFAAQSTLELQARLEPTPDAVFELVLGNGGEEATRLRIDVPNRGLTLDRTRTGRIAFHEQFPGAYTAPLRLIDGEILLRLFLDVASIEIFANDGESVMTSLIFPTTQIQSLQLRTLKGALIDSDFDAWKLKSAW